MRVAIVALLLLAGCGQPGRQYYVIDGDTVRHGGERLRLAGIDAPELPGHCREGRRCVQGDPYAAQAALQAILDLPASYCEGDELDFYQRRLVQCWTAQGNSINLYMIAAGHAEPYRPPS